jgi:hypothetical protein
VHLYDYLTIISRAGARQIVIHEVFQFLPVLTTMPHLEVMTPGPAMQLDGCTDRTDALESTIFGCGFLVCKDPHDTLLIEVEHGHESLFVGPGLDRRSNVLHGVVR